MAIPEKIYFKIGEVCELVGVQAHVLRYWETEFPQLSPQKNRSGQRSYRRRDVEVALRIKELLYDELFTIAGARKKLQAEARGEVPKLKIVRPEPAELPVPIDENGTPGLFDNDLEIGDLELDDLPVAPVERSPAAFNDDRREAIRTLASQLLELREMLKTDQTREATEHLRKNGV